VLSCFITKILPCLFHYLTQFYILFCLLSLPCLGCKNTILTNRTVSFFEPITKVLCGEDFVKITMPTVVVELSKKCFNCKNG
jgi:hypothetical protein